jgi:CRISPR-associated protein Cas2
MLFYLICYDIPNNKRRKKIADLLEGYGKRVQKSVFECQLQTKQYQQLKKRMIKICNPEEDNLRFYPISKHTLAQVEIWGITPEITTPIESVIV